MKKKENSIKFQKEISEVYEKNVQLKIKSQSMGLEICERI